jgi:transmembrane sensor
MTLETHSHERKLSADLVAEAAAWIAILHGPNRTTTTEKGFSQWLKASPDNARAFDEATAIWEESGNLARPARRFYSLTHEEGAEGHWTLRALVLATASVAALVVAGAFLYFRDAGIATDVGEQRMITLEDGTHVLMNTATRIVVSFDKHARKVELKKGEALFEVAKRPDWPFIVSAADRKIRAVGTEFVVRRDDQRLAVTLVEGRITVSPSGTDQFIDPTGAARRSGNVAQTPPSSTLARDAIQQAFNLTPGQRLTFEAGWPAKLDQPELDKTLAWQRREVALDNTPLSDAVAEMNRYSVVPLVIERSEAQNIRITGLFRAGDSASLARAVSEAYQLGVVEQRDKITITGVPHPTVSSAN